MTTDTNPNSNAPDTSVTDAGEGEELVRKVYVKDLQLKQRLYSVFRVAKKSKAMARSGKSFLTLLLVDRTGEIEGRVFEDADTADKAFVQNDYVLIKGHVTSFHNKLQIVAETIVRLDPEPIDPKEFAWTSPTPPPSATAPAGTSDEKSERGAERTERHPEGNPRAVAQIREIVERVSDPNVRALLLSFLDDAEIARYLPITPAAKGIHHAYRGGLADHLLSVMKLILRVADHYPMADRDLLVAGALLHDIMKVKEISADKGFAYTDEGRLVGHIVMTAQKIREKANALPNFPPLLEQHITHLVLSHHGQMEWGSPKVPMTIEAVIVHMVDSLDSRIASWLELMEKDQNETWTENARLYDRHLWKGALPTQRGRAPVESRGGGRRKGKKPRGERSAAGPQRAEKGERTERSDKPERPERPEKPKVAPPPELTFKPLNLLTGEGSEQKE